MRFSWIVDRIVIEMFQMWSRIRLDIRLKRKIAKIRKIVSLVGPEAPIDKHMSSKISSGCPKWAYTVFQWLETMKK